MGNVMFIPDNKVQAALDYLQESSADAAQAAADRIYMEEYRKTVKAQVMQMFANQSLGAQEREAYASPVYIEHLKAYQEAIRRDQEHRFMRAAAEAVIEAWRTMCSNERAIKL